MGPTIVPPSAAQEKSSVPPGGVTRAVYTAWPAPVQTLSGPSIEQDAVCAMLNGANVKSSSSAVNEFEERLLKSRFPIGEQS